MFVEDASLWEVAMQEAGIVVAWECTHALAQAAQTWLPSLFGDSPVLLHTSPVVGALDEAYLEALCERVLDPWAMAVAAELPLEDAARGWSDGAAPHGANWAGGSCLLGKTRVVRGVHEISQALWRAVLPFGVGRAEALARLKALEAEALRRTGEGRRTLRGFAGSDAGVVELQHALCLEAALADLETEPPGGRELARCRHLHRQANRRLSVRCTPGMAENLGCTTRAR